MDISNVFQEIQKVEDSMEEIISAYDHFTGRLFHEELVEEEFFLKIYELAERVGEEIRDYYYKTYEEYLSVLKECNEAYKREGHINTSKPKRRYENTFSKLKVGLM